MNAEPRDPAADRLVTIARCGTVATADLVRSVLESAGVEAFLQDQYLSQVFAFATGPIGGIKVQVRSSDLPAAIEALRRAPAASDAEAATAPAPLIVCPQCGSTDARFHPAEPLGFVIVLLEKLLPLPFLHGRWRCEECGKRWLEIEPNQR